MILEFAEFNRKFYLDEFRRIVDENNINVGEIEDYLYNTIDKFGGNLLKYLNWNKKNYIEQFMFFDKNRSMTPCNILINKGIDYTLLDIENSPTIKYANAPYGMSFLKSRYDLIQTDDLFYNIIFHYYSVVSASIKSNSIIESFNLDCNKIKSIFGNMDFKINLFFTDGGKITNYEINMVFELNKLDI